MTDAELSARAETIFTLAIQSDPVGAKLMGDVDETTRAICVACFVNGYLAGAKDKAANKGDWRWTRAFRGNWSSRKSGR